MVIWAHVCLRKRTNIGRSSNGRTTDFGSVYLGSSPSLPASLSRVRTPRRLNYTNMNNILYKAFGVFWEPVSNNYGDTFLADDPFCSNDICRSPLAQANLGTDSTGYCKRGWLCTTCNKEYLCLEDDYQEVRRRVNIMFEGHKRLGHKVYSLELPPTKVVDEAEDENYWVQARISEKNGNRMAVIYFGERVKGKQSKEDYSQVFLDFEDEQLRFDKTNKNPMKLLTKLTAEFPDSEVNLISKKNK